MPNDKPKIKPCPFCGSDKLYFNKVSALITAYHQVECRDCMSVGPSKQSELKSIEAWNQRAK